MAPAFTPPGGTRVVTGPPADGPLEFAASLQWPARRLPVSEPRTPRRGRRVTPMAK